MTTMLIAMDRAPSGRRIDADGHLHVETSNMTKATVNGYYGREIPGWDALGLDANRIYQMFRDPVEIAKGIETLNGKPVLFDHKMTTADDHQHMLTVGCTGTNAAFDGSYGVNSMSLWDGKAIRAVNSNRKRELSCGYRYRPDMTPGEYQGLHYDGVIRDIQFQHVALVVEGRAGPDVLVGDEAMKLMSRTGLMVSGAVQALVRPKLADGAAIDLAPALKDVTAASFAMDGAPKKLADAVTAIVTPHLAADQNVDDLADILAGIAPVAMDEDMIAEPVAKPKPVAKTAVVADPIVEPVAALDEATVATMIATATAKVRDDMTAAEKARADVKPVVGEVTMDSAPKIYKMALDHMKVATDGIPETGYGALFNGLRAAIAVAPKPGVALDAAPSADARTNFDKAFPAIANIGTIYGGQ